jgi:hypothetical protein
VEPAVPVFPPALVGVLRDRFASKGGCLAEATDDVIAQLLTTVFFAGLETYEGERNPIGVAFLGRSRVDFALSEGAESAGALLYQWKILQFESPRPFAIGELVKLAVAGVDRRIYSAVRMLEDGTLAISGLAREGLNTNSGPFVKIVASRPGCLSIRSGRDLLLGYERGAIFTDGEDVVLSIGPVRRALEATAGAAGLDGDIFSDYLDAVRSLVHEMAAHGRGGILIISPDEHPKVVAITTEPNDHDPAVVGALGRHHPHVGDVIDELQPLRRFVFGVHKKLYASLLRESSVQKYVAKRAPFGLGSRQGGSRIPRLEGLFQAAELDARN